MTEVGLRHVVWDWNGTLLDDVSACVTALNAVLTAHGMASVDARQYREAFGFPVMDYYRKLGFVVEAAERDRLAHDWREHYERAVADEVLREGVMVAVRYTRARGVPMSILSATERSVLERTLQQRGVRDLFDHVYGLSDHFASSKMAVGRDLVDRLPVSADGVLLVGDTIHDYDVAVSLGCRCVLVSGGHQSDARLNCCGCDVVAEHDLRDYLSRRLGG